MSKRTRDLVEKVHPHPSETNVILELIQYNDQNFEMHADLPIEELLTHFKKGQVNWINLDGLHNHSIIAKIGEHFSLHSLLLEDITSENQPKAEEYDGYLFFSLKMLYRIETHKIDYEQISFVVGKDFLLSFQEKAGDLFGPFRTRIKQNQGRVRSMDADYLLYRLIDIIVDNYYSVLDEIGHQIEETEEDIYKTSSHNEFQKIQKIKKELIFLRKALFPLRDALSKLVKGDIECINKSNVRYFSDIYDHVLHLIYSMDTYKDLTSSLTDMHINTLNTRMNEVMKVLAVISTIFMPLTFVVGIYGMNFDNMPELHWKFGYGFVMILSGTIVFGMLRYFKHKKWF